MHSVGANQIDDGMLLLERRLIMITTLIYDPYCAEALWRETRDNLRRDCQLLKEQLQVIIAHRNHGKCYMAHRNHAKFYITQRNHGEC